MIYKGKILFLCMYISYMEINEIVIKQKWTCSEIEILILPMNHKDKVAFFTSYISYMESNEISEKIEMEIFDLENHYISYDL